MAIFQKLPHVAVRNADLVLARIRLKRTSLNEDLAELHQQLPLHVRHDQLQLQHATIFTCKLAEWPQQPEVQVCQMHYAEGTEASKQFWHLPVASQILLEQPSKAPMWHPQVLACYQQCRSIAAAW